MDRLKAMSALLAAVDAGSFSGASRTLRMPLSTVSRKVAELEAHLRTRLVNRSGRRLSLTNAGHSYVAACRRLLEDLAEAERAAAGEYIAPRGDLAITAPIVFGRLHVLPIAIEFLRLYPEIDIRLLLVDRTVNLHEENVDLAVRVGALPDSSLVAARVGSIRRVICASPGYFAARGMPKHPRELRTHDCITFDGLNSSESWQFAVAGATVSVAIRSRLIVTTAEAALDAAVADIGVARVLSYQARGALHDGALVLALQEFEPTPWPLSLVHAGQRPLPLKLRAFIDFAAPHLRTRLGHE